MNEINTMGLIVKFFTTGHIGNFDLLFWAWAISIIIAFILLFIPDPITTAISIPLFGISIFLLSLLVLRGVSNTVMALWDIISHPFTVAFVASVLVLTIAKKIQKAIQPRR